MTLLQCSSSLKTYNSNFLSYSIVLQLYYYCSRFSKTSQGGLGLKRLEDEILYNAYVQYSSDSKIGTYQSKDDLWAKIESYYNYEAVDVNELERRNTRSLYARFEKIASSCTLFRAALVQAKSHNQSGVNTESTVSLCLTMSNTYEWLIRIYFYLFSLSLFKFKYTACRGQRVIYHQGTQKPTMLGKY